MKRCPKCSGFPPVIVTHPLLPNGKKDTLFELKCCGVSTGKWYPKNAAVAAWNKAVELSR